MMWFGQTSLNINQFETSLNVNQFETGLNVNQFETGLSASVNRAVVYLLKFHMHMGVYILQMEGPVL